MQPNDALLSFGIYICSREIFHYKNYVWKETELRSRLSNSVTRIWKVEAYYHFNNFKNPHQKICLLILETEKDGGKRNIDGLPLIHAPTGDSTHNLGVCLNREQNRQTFGNQDDTPTNWDPCTGLHIFLLNRSIITTHFKNKDSDVQNIYNFVSGHSNWTRGSFPLHPMQPLPFVPMQFWDRVFQVLGDYSVLRSKADTDKGERCFAFKSSQP